MSVCMSACVCACVCVCVCLRACARACVRACVRAYVRVCVRARKWQCKGMKTETATVKQHVHRDRDESGCCRTTTAIRPQ